MSSELHIEDPAVVAALYDPLRYRLFRLLETPRTVAELAAEVDLPPDRLYYHLRRLVECGVVRQVDVRAAGRHNERVFGRVADRIRFSGELDLDAGGSGLLRGIVDELEAGVRAVGPDATDGMVSYHVVSLDPERATELERRLRAVISDFEDATDEGEGARRFGLLGVLVPLAEADRADS